MAVTARGVNSLSSCPKVDGNPSEQMGMAWRFEVNGKPSAKPVVQSRKFLGS